MITRIPAALNFASVRFMPASHKVAFSDAGAIDPSSFTAANALVPVVRTKSGLALIIRAIAVSRHIGQFCISIAAELFHCFKSGGPHADMVCE